LTFLGCLGRGPGARPMPVPPWRDGVSPFPGRSARLPQKAAGPGATCRIAPTGNRPEDLLWALCPPFPWNQRRLMISACNGLAPGPGNGGKATFRWRPLIIRFERFPGFQASSSAGGHDSSSLFYPHFSAANFVVDRIKEKRYCKLEAAKSSGQE